MSNILNNQNNFVLTEDKLICEEESIFESGEIEIDESYFGARRIRGKSGRGAGGKTIVFGLKKEKWQSIYASCN